MKMSDKQNKTDSICEKFPTVDSLELVPIDGRYRGNERALSDSWIWKTENVDRCEYLLERYFSCPIGACDGFSKPVLLKLIEVCDEFQNYDCACEIMVTADMPMETFFNYPLEFLGIDIIYDGTESLLEYKAEEVRQFLNENDLCSTIGTADMVVAKLALDGLNWEPSYVYKVAYERLKVRERPVKLEYEWKGIIPEVKRGWIWKRERIPKKLYKIEHKRFVKVDEEGNEVNDILLLGIFSSEEECKKLIPDYQKQPGFRDYSDGFQIQEIEVKDDKGGESVFSLAQVWRDKEYEYISQIGYFSSFKQAHKVQMACQKKPEENFEIFECRIDERLWEGGFFYGIT